MVVSAQVPRAVRDQLEQRAREGDRSLSAEVRRQLVRALEREAAEGEEKGAST